jgi:DNA polymerase III epsilon subunit-like protein
MSLIILDLEYNQPSRAIIQIGAVEVVPQSQEIRQLYKEDVNPHEKIDPYITRLTGITQAQSEHARSLEPVLKDFWTMLHRKSEVVLCGWGDDAPKIIKDSKKLGLHMPVITQFDLSVLWKLFQLVEPVKLPKSGGLKKVMAYYDIPFEGKQHNAYNDARMTAKVVLAMSEHVRELLG